jgi:hypothetical protein
MSLDIIFSCCQGGVDFFDGEGVLFDFLLKITENRNIGFAK